MNITNSYLEEVGSLYSNSIRIRPKSESTLLKLIRPFAVIFNQNFWDGYIQCIGNTIWVPDGWLDTGNEKARLEVVAHEVIHIMQKKQHPFLLHEILYLFPQVLSILALFAFLAIPFSSYWLLALLFLVCLAPWPAPFRYAKELQAYKTKILWFVYVWKSTGPMIDYAKNAIVKQLSGAPYYFAQPCKDKILQDLDFNIEVEFETKDEYAVILEFLRRHSII